MSKPFRYYLRVRYGECDAQKVVFNSRYSESVSPSKTTKYYFSSGKAKSPVTTIKVN